MGVEITYEGNFKEVLNALDETAKQRVLEASREVHKQTVLNLTGDRHGRRYYVPGTHQKYTASAVGTPGEFPASATGTLRKTLKWGYEGEGISLTGYVGSDQKYAPMLEYGTHKIRGGMWPRRWLGRTFESMEEKIKEIFRRPWL